MRLIKITFAMLALSLTSGCQLVLLSPSGDVAAQQGDLIIYSTVLMLIVILPVMALTVFFAWKYRASNDKARYEPDWDHSISLEIVIWSVPLAIIICLAGLTWVATHRLDPYQDLPRISETKPIDPNVEPLQVQVVAMDWKWMFIYPEQNIATIGEAAVIVDRPVEFKITSTTVMNAFYVPEMAGMIYAMAGMETELNAVLNSSGTFKGFSGNYSGYGFSQMDFEMHAFDDQGFEQWVESVRAKGTVLDRPAFLEADEPSIGHPVTYYGDVEHDLWRRIVNLCVGQDRLCQDDMMMVDALGGGGLEGLYNRQLFAGICSQDDPEAFFALVRPELFDQKGEILAAVELLPAAYQSSQPPEAAN